MHLKRHNGQGGYAGSGAARIAILYFVIAMLWILASDTALRWFMGQSPPQIAQTIKGWGFVAVTAVMLYALVRRLVGKEIAAQEALQAAQAQRLAELEKARIELERRVGERTADLSDANRILQQQIAQRQQIEGALQRAKSMAESANRAKTDFVASVSHEIRTPLTSIVGYADLLQGGDLSPEERRQYLTIVQQNAALLLTLIADVLDVSQIEAGQLRIAPVACGPGLLLMEVVDLLKERAAKKHLSLTLECPAPLPPAVHTDPTRLRQILLNLVANAIKFTQHGGIRIVARMETEASEPMLRVEVIDTGPGMSAEQLEHVFEPFYQTGETRDKKLGGVGLGLAIARELVEKLGGTINAQSWLGAGTTFTVRVPTQHQAAPQTPPPPERASAQLRGHILLTEDDAHIRRLVTIYLEHAGADVTAVESGMGAVSALRQAAASHAPVQLVLLDMQMPGMDGVQTAGALRAEGFAGPIIALTAYTMEGERERWIGAGCDDMVGKPIDRGTFLQTLARHLAAVGTRN